MPRTATSRYHSGHLAVPPPNGDSTGQGRAAQQGHATCSAHPATARSRKNVKSPRRCLITRPSIPLTRPSALSPHSAASSMLATAAVAISCFSTKSRNEPRPPRVTRPPAAVPPETAAQSRHALSRQPHARRSRNSQYQSTQRETATVIPASPVTTTRRANPHIIKILTIQFL
jgi:hypothetical protein